MTGSAQVLTQEQLHQYQEDGYLFLPDFLNTGDLSDIYEDLERLTRDGGESTVFESSSEAVRALHGSQLVSAACDRLCRSASLLAAARAVVGSDVYLYQFKINMKAPFVGEVWPWHQDYIFWRNEDGMPAPDVVSIVVFLDEVTEFNGPMYLIPRSHAKGLIEPIAPSVAERSTEGGWIDDVSADLKYQIPHSVVRTLAEDGGIAAPKGPPGSVFFFHSNLVHGSAPNISPFPRRIAILTYNSTANVPSQSTQVRPAFLVNPISTPL